MPLRRRTEQRILDAAEELFFVRGIRGTPIDAVIERAEVSPATLYRGFASKEALVTAALRRRQDEWLEVWDAVAARQRTPKARLLAVFDALAEFRHRPGAARWCAFLGSAAEYADDPEIAAAVAGDTDALRERLTAAAADVVGEADAAALAERILLVFTGALAMRLRDPGIDEATAREVAAALVDAHGGR